MHILVPVKRVVDYNVKVRVKSDGSALDIAGVKMSINPFDEVAVEQAVRLREAGLATRITVVACGGAICQDVLRTALAMGADAAVLLETETSPPAGPAVLDALTELVRREGIGLVLCGKQAIDDDLGDTAPMLAALLDWPQAISVSRIEIDGSALKVACDGDQGLDLWSLPLPAVLGVDLRLCDPRSITLPNMMKAKKAAITRLPLATPSEGGADRCTVLGFATPPDRPAGVRVTDVQGLIDRLRLLPALTPAA